MFYNPCAPGSRLGMTPEEHRIWKFCRRKFPARTFIPCASKMPTPWPERWKLLKKFGNRSGPAAGSILAAAITLPEKIMTLICCCSCLTDWRERYRAPGFIWNLARPWP